MTKRRRIGLFSVFLVLFFIITPYLIFYASGYVFDFHQKKFVQTGGLYFKVNPKDYSVYLNGKLKKKATPFLGTVFIKNLPPRQYNIEIKKDNYYPWIKNLNVKEGLITESRHITLFPKKLDSSIISRNISSFYPENNYLLLVKKEKNNWTLWRYSLLEKKEKLLFKSNILKENLELKNIKTSSDGNRLLLTLQMKDKKEKFYIIDASSEIPSAFAISLPKEINVINFNPLDKNEILFTNGNKLFRYNLENKTKPSIVIDSLVTYYLFKNKIIWLATDGFVYESDLSGKPIAVLNYYPFPLKKDKEHKIIIGNEISKIIIKEGNSTYYYLEKNGKFKKISDNFENIKISPDSAKIALFSNHEIWVFFWNDILEQPLRKEGNLIFLTRFSENIRDLDWINPYYILFNTESKLKISEIDTRDNLNVTDIAQYKKARILFKRDFDEIFVLSNSTLFAYKGLTK